MNTKANKQNIIIIGALRAVADCYRANDKCARGPKAIGGIKKFIAHAQSSHCSPLGLYSSLMCQLIMRNVTIAHAQLTF